MPIPKVQTSIDSFWNRNDAGQSVNSGIGEFMSIENNGRRGYGSQGTGLDTSPDVKGEWLGKADFGLGVAEVGLGVWNAFEQRKMNKFMRGYYGDQMDLQRADFGNAAHTANLDLEARERSRQSGQGHTFDSDENKAAVKAFMQDNRLQETF